MPGSQSERILVVEDERKISEAVTAGLKSAGYEVLAARTVEDGLFLLHSQHPDMIVLDLGLPGMSGMEMLRQLRAMGIMIPVLILTSNNSLDDRVAALDLGADDFLLKPFSTAELNARMRAISRRGRPTQVAQLSVADLEINLETRTVVRGGMQLELTAREFDLIVYFVGNRGRTVSREMLARDVWHETSRFTPIDNVIDVQITRLRRKLDDPFPQKLLRTVRGVGFILGEADA
ncbi:response regulator transcription factor [Granulicella tundricola]|uniref:Two component transcriptional regulator, winged helix family n=1 Tax=Granulicella tundricola (strain ATCC BAA-1859 / DSM 23138 / MP5ACTX9) TaxID=1198114 RepID=E8X2M7_GRATM|nr:response regulator transcription factor [Granulicella tundricola]ADW70324.1 two component transcriptional regulator, winged helix family [Granulicella tundricola MP5ACTX9]